MKSKIVKIITALFLMLFSFYYSTKSTDFVKNQDPIMLEINKNAKKYIISSESATIKDNTIIPGRAGKKVDKKKSYDKMKKYGMYNESLTSLETIQPTVSIKSYYNKYVISGNKDKKAVALVFKIQELYTLKTLVNYFDNKNISATFFISNLLLENNSEYLKKLTNYELELLFDKTSDINISSSSNYLYNITNKYNKYCYTEKEDEKLLNICNKYHFHTVIPNIIVKANSVSTIKKNLSNGSIISFNYNIDIKNNLDYIINYIESKGYSFNTLDKLLEE